MRPLGHFKSKATLPAVILDHEEFRLAILFCFLSIQYVYSAGSGKKGVGLNPYGYLCNDINAFTNIHWWYDWAENPWYHHDNHCHVNQRSGRIPMIWGWRKNIEYPIYLPHDTNTVLVFNEPNFYSQANLSAAEAARIWKNEIQPKVGGKTLVGPAAAPCGSKSQCYDNSFEWFTEFFQHCSDCRVDYIATHAYWCNADTTMNMLHRLWTTFHKPIWLTEFACPQSNSVDQQLNYMKQVLPRLEAAHYVAKYAWFTTRTRGDGWVMSAASLLDQHSSTLTTLGNYYNNF